MARTYPLSGGIELIPLTDIRVPRGKQSCDYTQAEVEALARAVEATGQLEQPVIVRTTADAEKPFELVTGGLRRAAVHHLGWADLPCRVRRMDEKAVQLVAVLEDLSGKTEHALPLGWTLIRAMEATGWKQKEFVATTRLHPSQISEAVRSAKAIPEQVLEEAATHAGIPSGLARALPRVDLRHLRSIQDGTERRVALERALEHLATRAPVDGNAEVRPEPILIAEGGIRLDPTRVGALGPAQFTRTIVVTLWWLLRTWIDNSPLFARLRPANRGKNEARRRARGSEASFDSPAQLEE